MTRSGGPSHFDDYDLYHGPVAGRTGRRHGLEQIGFWRKLIAHPGYDSFWRDQAMDKILAAQPLKVPVMLVHSLWDQEDIYGAPAVYKAIKPKDVNNDKVFWCWARGITGRRSKMAARSARSNSTATPALYFRMHILLPFLDHYPERRCPQTRRRAGHRI